jgi:hypothetical protein
VIELRHEVENEWRRLRPAGVACPLPLGFQPFVRRKVYDTVPLEVVCERMIDGLPPFSVEMRYVPRPGTKMGTEPGAEPAEALEAGPAEQDRILEANLPAWRGGKIAEPPGKTRPDVRNIAGVAEVVEQKVAVADAVAAEEPAAPPLPQIETQTVKLSITKRQGLLRY